MTSKILIGEDEKNLRTILKKLLQKKDMIIDVAGDGELILKKLQENEYALALLDINLPSLSGLEILKKIKKEKPTTFIIVITAQDTMENAIQAMKLGAYDYLTKPFELEELEIVVDKALQTRRLSTEVQSLRKARPTSLEREVKIVGRSKAAQEIFKTIGKVADSDVSVLIAGESGTGKELVARAIHRNSPRASKPFVAVNCAAIPKDLLESELFGYRKGAFTGADENRAGFFEMANQGTLFLDEIGDLPLNLQAKLLRILQEKEVQRLGSSRAKAIDVRIITATNQNLKTLIKKKQFREDLFFRLNVIPFNLPPLRKRLEDLGDLVSYFLERVALEMGTAPRNISSEALSLLRSYSWPGNIRELENVIKRAAILSGHQNLNTQDFAFFLQKSEEALEENIEKMGLEELIEAKLKPFFQQTQGLSMTHLYDTVIKMAERPLLKMVLTKTNNNQIKAAQILGINRNTLRKKINELGITLK